MGRAAEAAAPPRRRRFGFEVPLAPDLVLFEKYPAKAARLLLIAFVFGAVAGSMALGVFLARYVGPYYLGMAIPEDVMQHSQHVVLVSIAGMLFALGAIALHAGGLGNEEWDADRLGREL